MIKMKNLLFILLSVSIFNCYGFVSPVVCDSSFTSSNKLFFVAPKGDNYDGNGSRLSPWGSIEVAVSKVPDGATIIVKKGIYQGSIKLKRQFKNGVIIRSEFPYQARLRNNKRVLAIIGNSSHITIEGFDISHIDNSASPLVVHIDGGSSSKVNNITLRNNIIHDSYNNDLLKINNGAENIKIYCNMFYNQGDSDEHIDINSVRNITISDNVFFNDFISSHRKITGKSASFIVVKDSNAGEDNVIGSNNINIHRNILLNWQGSYGHGFILIGEDGKPYFEAKSVNVYNNLFLGNSKLTMRSPFSIKGAKDVSFFNNTITGDLPTSAYGMRVHREGENPINTNIHFYNNIWSDDTGTLGQGKDQSSNDFSDTLPFQLDTFTFENNLIYNGGASLPYSLVDKINPTGDTKLVVLNPVLPKNSQLIIPHWLSDKNQFFDGSYTIRGVFEKIVFLTGIPKNNKAVQSGYNPLYPKKDIVGQIRSQPYSLGAFQISNDTF